MEEAAQVPELHANGKSPATILPFKIPLGSSLKVFLQWALRSAAGLEKASARMSEP